jgi:ABC-type branched-subunit amino acid transport system ATPase component
MLEVRGLSASYGKHQALAGVDLDVRPGEIVVMLGANGAGKSTLLKAIAGLVRPQPGSRVTFDGRDLLALPPHEIVEAGVALVPEGRGIFAELTVRENLELGAYARRARAGEADNLARIKSLFPRLAERGPQLARTMSGGEQQMVAIGRALMSAPKLLLLDEPSLGLSPLMCGELFQALARVRETGVGILLVEQNAVQGLNIADRGYLIETGRIVGQGSAQSLRSDPAVQRAYLGVGDAAPGVGTSMQGVKSDGQERAMKHVSLMIGDRDVFAADGRTFDRIDPFTGSVATRAAAASIGDAIAAADAAAAAFPAWSALGPSERRGMLLKAADLLDARGAEFSELMTAECGAIGPWGHFNSHFAASLMREAAAMTTQVAGEVIPSDKPNSFAMAIRQPAGVVLGIAPWNAPVILGVRAIAMPLACGNTVVLKASEMCPATHTLIGTIMREAGLPHGVVNVVTNAPTDAGKVVETLIAHPAVRRINFTGSTKVGHIIAETAARYLKPVLLELGGKAPDGHPRRRRPRRGREGRGVRLLRQYGTDLHVDRAADRGRKDRRCVRGEVRRQGQEPAAWRSTRPCGARRAGDQGGGRAQQGIARRRDTEGCEARGRRRVQRQRGERDRGRSRHAGDAHLHRGIVRAGEAGDPREGRRGGDPHRQRHRIRSFGGRVRQGRGARFRGRQAHPVRHLPHQRADRA